jgi:hypothetical protein
MTTDKSLRAQGKRNREKKENTKAIGGTVDTIR